MIEKRVFEMRTFEQYIDESYSFRLGGSQKKGFDQTKAKTIDDVKVGDVIYFYYDKRKTDLPLRSYKIYNIEKTQKEIRFDIIKGGSASLIISKNHANPEYAYTHSGSIISADSDFLLELINNEYNTNYTIDDIKKCFY